MPVLSENKCMNTRFELSIHCIEAKHERFPKEYICTKMFTATGPFVVLKFDKTGKLTEQQHHEKSP